MKVMGTRQIILLCFLFTVIETAVSYGTDLSGTTFQILFVNTTNSPNTSMNLRVINPGDTNATVSLLQNKYGTSTLHSFTLSPKGGVLIPDPEIGGVPIGWCSSTAKVYVLQEVMHSSSIVDASYFIPSATFGVEYYVVGFCRYDTVCRITVFAPWGANIQAELKVHPSLPVYDGNGNEVVGRNFTFFLYSGTSVTFESEGDMSGTYLKGSDQFTVFHSTLVTRIHDLKSQDGIYVHGTTRQMYSYGWLGTRYIIPRATSQDGGLVKIIATMGRTEVEIPPLDPFVIENPGDVVLKMISSDHGIVIDASFPILVAIVDLHKIGDKVVPNFPTMIIVPSVEQWIGNNTYTVPSWMSGSIPIFLLLHESDKSSTKIDGVEYSDLTMVNVPSTPYYETEFVTQSKRSLSLLNLGETFFLSNSYRDWTCFGVVNRQNVRLPLNHGLNPLNQRCVPSNMVMGDHVDNDCDRFIDEDQSSGAGTCTDCAHPEPEGNKTNAGKEFYVSFMYTQWSNDVSNISVTITTTTDLMTQVMILCDKFQDWNISFSLYPGEIRHLSATRTQIAIVYAATQLVSDIMVRVLASADVIVVGQYIPTSQAVSAFPVYPVASLGTDYYVITPAEASTYLCVVVPTNGPDTVVSVLYRRDIRDLSVNFIAIHKYYRKGELMRTTLRSVSTLQIVGNVDITGTRIRASRPIAVFCGGQLSDGGMVSKQLLPTKLWGKKFLTPDLSEGREVTTKKLKIVSRTSRNVVRIKSANSVCSNDINITLANPGSFFEDSFGSSSNCQIFIESLKAVEVMFISDRSNSDPFSVLLPSIQHFVSKATVVIPPLPPLGNTVFYVGYVTLNDFGFLSGNVKVDGVFINGSLTETTTGIHTITANLAIMPYVLVQGYIGSTNDLFSYSFVADRLLHVLVQECVPSEEIPDLRDNDCDGIVDEGNCSNGISIDYSTNLMFGEDCHIPLLSPTTTVGTDALTSTAARTDFTATTQVSTITVVEDTTDFTDTTQRSTISVVDTTDSNYVSTEMTQKQTSVFNLIQSTSSASQTSVAIVSTTDISITSTDLPGTSNPTSGLSTGGPQTTEAAVYVTITDRPSGSSTSGACLCPCNPDILDTEEKLRKRLKELELALHLDKHKLSSSIRKLNSASDNRTSVKYLGFSGVVVLVVAVSFVVVLDVVNLIRTIKTRCTILQNERGQRIVYC